MYNNEFWHRLEKLVSESELVIDRPKGMAHPRYPDFIYKLDYGYLKGTSSMDGDGIDVWVGSKVEKSIDGVICIIDTVKKDSEIKILLSCNDADKEIVNATHNNEFMSGILIDRNT